MGLFSKKYKVTFYMKSGNVIENSYDEFSISKLYDEKDREMSWKGAEKSMTIDLNEVEAVIIHD